MAFSEHLFDLLHAIFTGKLADYTYTEEDMNKSVNRELQLFAFNKTNELFRTNPGLFLDDTFLESTLKSWLIIEIRGDKELDEILKPKDLVDIQCLMKSVNQILHGKFFLCRLLVKPIVNASITFIVEDSVGKNAVTVVIYENRLPSSSFNKGTYLAILNPTFMVNKFGYIFVHCYDPNEVLILTRNQIRRRLPDLKWHDEEESVETNTRVMEHRNKGNKLFVAGKYEEALKIYSDGLALDPNNVELLSNRSLCLLRLEKYVEALENALQCLKKNPVHVKAIYRASQAYIGLGLFDKAKDLLSAKIEVLKRPSKEIEDLLAKTKDRILQRDRAIYNMAKLDDKDREELVIQDINEEESVETNTRVMELRNKGNKLFVAGKYDEALKIYSDGLALDPNNVELLSNRSLCLLRLEKYEEALDNALQCLKKDSVHVKAIYRASQAYIGLGQYEKARDLLSAKVEVLKPPSKEIEDLLAKAKERILQRDHGIYNMAEFYKHLKDHDIAEYYGPVKVGNAGKKGRGLFVTKDVEAGTLLICCKAFAHYTAPLTYSHNQDLESFVDLIAEKIRKNPEVGKDLYQLWAGKEMGTLDPSKDNCTMVDKERIRRIVKFNLFKAIINNRYHYYLFITPSYINNECIDVTCCLTYFGDVCQARSTKPLKKGQEVLFKYSRDLWDDIDFRCECALCKFENQEPLHVRLEKLDLKKFISITVYSNPNDLARDIKKMRELTVGSPFAAYYLHPLLFELGSMYYVREQFRKAKKPYEEMLRDWRGSSRHYVKAYFKASLELSSIYFVLHDIPNFKKIKEDVVELTKIVLGSFDLPALEVFMPNVKKEFFELLKH